MLAVTLPPATAVTGVVPEESVNIGGPVTVRVIAAVAVAVPEVPVKLMM
jgi:hypothetical protein